VVDVYSYLHDTIEKANSYGVNDIVVDVGIGFGKTLEHNLKLIQNLEHFLSLDVPLLIGASRKSMIDMISPSLVEERLAGTLAIHLKAVQHGASIVRVHDVYEHKQALAVQKMLETF
jgi:dihydropteroate synthase